MSRFGGVIVGASIVLAAVWASGCGGEESTEPVVETQIPEPQPDSPLLAPEDVSLAESFRLGARSAADAGLRFPGDVGVDAEGNVYVLDMASPPRIAKFDSTGQFLYNLGERGEESPQDRIGSAEGFEVSPWNVVMVVDLADNALSSFLTLGTFVSSMPLDGIGVAVRPLPEFGEYLLHKWDQNRRTSYVIHMRTPFDSLGVAYSIGIPSGQPIQKELRDIFFHTASDRAGNLYVGFPEGYPVRVVRPTGETVRLVNLARRALRKPPEMVEAEREEALDRLRAEGQGLPEDVIREAAEPDSTLPIIEELIVDPSARLWVRTHRAYVVGSTPYDVFNENGDYMARVEVPGRVIKTSFGPSGRLWAVDVGSESGPEVVAYDVRLGGVAGGMEEIGPEPPPE